MKILDTLEVTPRLEQMETSLRMKTGKPVIHIPLAGKAGEPGLNGRYIYDQQRGNIIELKSGYFDEYTVAHELAHGLMRADGFVSVGFIGEDWNFEEIAARIRSAILHPAMSAYMNRFKYDGQHEQHYRKKMGLFTNLKSLIALGDETEPWSRVIRALEFAETLLIFPKGVEKLERLFSKSAPRIWADSTQWQRMLLGHDLNTPYGCRAATVALVKELDSHLIQDGAERLLLDCLFVPWVFRLAEAQRPALSVFRLDHRRENETYVGFVRYVLDGSAVVRLILDGPKEASSLREEWGGLTALELMVSLEGKTPWNSARSLS